MESDSYWHGIWGDEGWYVLKLGSDESCTALRIYEKAPLNCILSKDKFYSMNYTSIKLLSQKLCLTTYSFYKSPENSLYFYIFLLTKESIKLRKMWDNSSLKILFTMNMQLLFASMTFSIPLPFFSTSFPFIGINKATGHHFSFCSGSLDLSFISPLIMSFLQFYHLCVLHVLKQLFPFFCDSQNILLPS